MSTANLVLWITLFTCVLTVSSESVLRDRRAAGANVLLNSVEDQVDDIFDLSQLLNTTVVINSATEYIAGALGAYYSIPRSVIDLVRPGPLPYGKVDIKINCVTCSTIQSCKFVFQSYFFPMFVTFWEVFYLMDRKLKSHWYPRGKWMDSTFKKTSSPLQLMYVYDSIINTVPFTNRVNIKLQYVVWLIPVLIITLLCLVIAAFFPCVGCFFCCCRFCGKCGGKAYHYQANHQTVKCIVLSIIILLSCTFQL